MMRSVAVIVQCITNYRSIYSDLYTHSIYSKVNVQALAVRWSYGAYYEIISVYIMYVLVGNKRRKL